MTEIKRPTFRGSNLENDRIVQIKQIRQRWLRGSRDARPRVQPFTACARPRVPGLRRKQISLRLLPSWRWRTSTRIRSRQPISATACLRNGERCYRRGETTVLVRALLSLATRVQPEPPRHAHPASMLGICVEQGGGLTSARLSEEQQYCAQSIGRCRVSALIQRRLLVWRMERGKSA